MNTIFAVATLQRYPGTKLLEAGMRAAGFSLLDSLGGFSYSRDDSDITVDLYAPSEKAGEVMSLLDKDAAGGKRFCLNFESSNGGLAVFSRQHDRMTELEFVFLCDVATRGDLVDLNAVYEMSIGVLRKKGVWVARYVIGEDQP